MQVNKSGASDRKLSRKGSPTRRPPPQFFPEEFAEFIQSVVGSNIFSATTEPSFACLSSEIVHKMTSAILNGLQSALMSSMEGILELRAHTFEDLLRLMHMSIENNYSNKLLRTEGLQKQPVGLVEAVTQTDYFVADSIRQQPCETAEMTIDSKPAPKHKRRTLKQPISLQFMNPVPRKKSVRLSRKSIRTQPNEQEQFDKQLLLSSMHHLPTKHFYVRRPTMQQQLARNRKSISIKHYESAHLQTKSRPVGSYFPASNKTRARQFYRKQSLAMRQTQRLQTQRLFQMTH